MQRRTYLSMIATLPFTSALSRVTAPSLPVEEDCVLWWRYVLHAIKLGDPKYCTDRYLDMVEMRSHLDHTTDREAQRMIRAAFRGAYSMDDVPAEYRQSI